MSFLNSKAVDMAESVQDDQAAISKENETFMARSGGHNKYQAANIEFGAQSVSQESIERQIYAEAPDRFLNREISWLSFAMRLLELSSDASLPLLERGKFLAIFSSGLDEFFQVRVAGIKEQIAAKINATSPDGMRPEEQLDTIREIIKICIKRANRIFTDDIRPSLTKTDIKITDYAELSSLAKDHLHFIFTEKIFPVLTPLAIDPGHPFPYISNLSLNIAVFVVDKESNQRRFARVKVPIPLLPRYVAMPEEGIFVLLEQVISAHLKDLFPHMEVEEAYLFRVIRNADLDFDEDEADDLLEAIELELRRRRFGRAVCVEVQANMPQEVRNLLLTELELSQEDCYEYDCQLDFSSLLMLYDLKRPDLKYSDWLPVTIPDLINQDGEQADIFDVLKNHDILLHHPYESFASSVEAFISQSADDDDVLAIKQTLYRTSGDALFVSSLTRAVESGKQVAALVELKARFDEDKNIVWAKQLERAGVHVVYGVVGLKTHSKTVLIVRKEGDKLSRYVHIGTGNYNAKTARTYEDIGLLSSSPDLGADLTDLFNYLTGFSKTSKTRSLLLAPENLRTFLLAQIEEQIILGEEGEIVLKANGLTDPQIIDNLYRASQNGVKVTLIIRGLCSLRPMVKGFSDNITVRSIVGRFLEHSRIYRFGKSDSDPNLAPELILADRLQKGGDILDRAGIKDIESLLHARKTIDKDVRKPLRKANYFIGSADLMERNLDRRIEAVVPVTNDGLRARLEGILQISLLDDMFSWDLQPDATWRRNETIRGISSQEIFMQIASYQASRNY